uniref:Reverse transcriptase domain-containing protein n=1 Tax=Tanacetum cinerariifolium TaxID=118510 RepID=A0A6L2NVK0_TANCI|nr:reverse transcriptase domain-containing protein [Tanacetum cinerariifolium]
MSTNEQTPVSQPASAVRNTLGKEQVSQDLGRPASDAALQEYCDRNYHQLLPIIAEKEHQKKVQQDKLKAVKARLNFEEASQYSGSGTPSRRRSLNVRLGSRYARNMSGSPEPRRGHFESPRKRGPERRTVFKRLEKGVFHRLRDKGKGTSAYSNDSKHRSYHSSCRDTESCYQSSRSRETKFVFEKRHNKRTSSRRTKVLSESADPFTPRIRYFDFPKTQMPSHIKTYDESEDPKDHSEIFQAVAKTERWAMPTWCHMFISTLTGNARVWFDDLSKESIDCYNDLKEAFLENYLQQKKCIKDPVEIHNIKQRDGESTEEFVRRYKLECMDVKGAPGCMKISGFMHEITNPELIKRLHDKISKSIDEIMKATTIFLREEVTASNPKQWKDREKAAKKGETSGKDKPLAILMVQPWQRLSKQNITQTFSPESVISFPPLGKEDGTEGLMIIKVEIRGHFVHRMYVDGGSSLKILYEHCFNIFRHEVRSQMILATTPLVGFSEEIIWPLGQISFLVKIGNEEHSTSAWMNFMIVRSPSQYNRIIGRLGVRKIQALPFTAYGMLKFPVADDTVTLRSSMIIPLECIMVSGPGIPQSLINQVAEEKIQVAIHPEYPE